jgi:hypothetical protein
MESKKINQLATELAPDLSDLTIIGDPTTGISKKITLSQMASLFTGTVEEYANFAAFPLVGVADTIYIAKDTNVIYRWDSTAYVVLSPNIIASLVFNDANGFDGTIALVGSVATLTITTALTTGSVGFIGASGALLQDNANFFWDDTNNRLGLGTNAPTTALDVFGSGIIGRINGTSTNNAYLGFSSAGTNKWSVGNVQSDHRFRIFSEANSAELISVLQTGEFGIGIANPTTKFHIDGAASALIANLDANVSVAKSVSFRSDNSNRFNIEVSGTESGSNVGADFFIRRYSDAGSLIDTPLTITRSTGNATFSGILTTPQIKAATSAGLSINANSGTQVADFGAGGSANITFFGGLAGTSASFSGNGLFGGSTNAGNAGAFTLSVGVAGTTAGGIQLWAATNQSSFLQFGDSTVSADNFRGYVGYNHATDTLSLGTASTDRLTIASTGGINIPVNLSNSNTGLDLTNSGGGGYGNAINFYQSTTKTAQILCETSVANTSEIYFKTMVASTVATRLFISSAGNIGIGTLTPAGKLDIFAGANQILLFKAELANQTSLRFNEAGNGPRLFTDAATEEFRMQQQYTGTGFLTFYTGTTERSRITNGGFFKASNTGTYSVPSLPIHELCSDQNYPVLRMNNSRTSGSEEMIRQNFSGYSPNNTSSWFIYSTDASAVRFYVTSAGGIGNYQANNVNLSDERTKKDISPLESYWNKFKAIEIVKFKYKDQTHDDFNIGVIAQQVEKVAPEFIDIDGFEKPELDEEGNIILSDEEPLKSVYTADLHHATIKVLQEAMAKIESLEEKVKQLELK